MLPLVEKKGTSTLTNTPKMTNVNNNNGRPGILHHSEQKHADLMEQIAKIDSKLGDFAKSLSNDTEMTTGSFDFYPGKKDLPVM